MSYSTLYAVFKTVATPVKEYRNSWGTGPMIWDHLCKTYLRDGSNWMANNKALWALATSDAVPLSLRACHVLTFDFAMVPREHMEAMAKLVAKGGKTLGIAEPALVNHFPAIADDLANLRLTKRASGVGLNCTSVSDTWGNQRKHWTHDPWDCYSYITGQEQPK